MTRHRAQSARGQPHPEQPGFVELLFDVVFVFAFTRFSERLVEQLTWFNFYATMVLLLAMWWVWYRMAWTTNRYDPQRPVIKLMVIATMLASLLMAAALPNALREYDRGLVFASIYVAVQTLRHLWLVLLGGDRTAQLVSLRIFFWALISAVSWIAGIFSQGGARLAWWSVAVALDYAGGLLDFPTPRLGRAGLRSQTVGGEHLTERYRQLLIIALGETILVSGIQFSPYAFEGDRTAALIISFVITVLLWQIYFYRAGELLPTAIAVSRAPARVGELASYAHLIMVAGVSLSAVGAKLTIAHPFGKTTTAWVVVILGGPALFLVGRALLDFTAFSHVSWSRPIGLLLLAALLPAVLRLPLVLVAVVAAAVLAGIAVANLISWRIFPSVPGPPTNRPAYD
ncbi:MAG TPA: low temperature requirement protein A [Micromonosporaceae bacterium]|nr:low temperature requirement protein A [Micromonosporaceae bacterium]